MASKDEARAELARRELARRKQSAAPEQMGVTEDVVKSAGAGLVRGGASLAGMAGDMGSLWQWGTDKLTEKMFGDDPKMREAIDKGRQFGAMADLPTSADTTSALENVTGKLHEPQTTAGEYARTAGEFAPAALAGPGGIARRTITQALIPAAASETAGQMTEGTAAEPYARVVGALGGAIAPAALSRAVTPFPIPADRQRVIQALQGEGVELTAGQAVGSDKLRYMESELGGFAGQRMMAQQGDQFTSAALRRAGINAPRATPEVMDDAFTRIGNEFDTLAARNTAQADNQFANDMAGVQADYHMFANPLQRQVLDDAINGVIQTVQRGNGTIPGDVYQSMRSRLDKAARGAGQDVELRDAFFGVRNALDEAMERAMPAADADAWRQARREYRNMIVLEKAATGAGERAAEGVISPAQLRNATVQKQGSRNYVRGQGDFAELARDGVTAMTPLPQSGTAPRTWARNLGMGIPALLGGAGGAVAGNAPGAMAGMALGAAVPATVGRAMLSRPGRAYLTNQLMNGQPGVDPRYAAIAALLANEERPALPAN